MTGLRSVTIPAEDGVYPGVDEESYHRDPTSLSVSGAKFLLPPSCPAKFRHLRDNPSPARRVFDFGHLAHRMVLGEGARFAVLDPAVHGLKRDGTVADSPRATAGWKSAETEARQKGLIPVSVDEWRAAEAMANAVNNHPAAGELFADGQPELAVYRRDAATGVRLRGRLDWLRNDGVIVDYKTSVSAEPGEVERLFHRFRYHMQAAWYLDLVAGLGIAEAPRFVFVVQEKTPPFLVTVVEYDQSAIAAGRALNRQAISLYADLAAAQEWPPYASTAVTISLPRWATEGSETDTTASELINELEGIYQ